VRPLNYLNGRNGTTGETQKGKDIPEGKKRTATEVAMVDI
jgi:hypothetical protein